MGRFYTEKDVERWEEVDRRIGRLHQDKLAANPPPAEVDFRLSALSHESRARGMRCIAKGHISEALACFRESIEWRLKMYERCASGLGRAMEAGHFQDLLVAYVTNDDELISRYARHYRALDGTEDSVFLGRVVKCVALKDLEGARKGLLQKRPTRFETQFSGYPDCLEAIVEKDQGRFIDAIAFAATKWSRWSCRVEKGLPGCVCFLQGVGLVRMAEKTIGARIPVMNEYLPPELLQ
jgi:hypothetical protein